MEKGGKHCRAGVSLWFNSWSLTILRPWAQLSIFPFHLISLPTFYAEVSLTVFLSVTYRILITRVIMTLKTPRLSLLAHLHMWSLPCCHPYSENHPYMLITELKVLEKQVQNHISLLLPSPSPSSHKWWRNNLSTQNFVKSGFYTEFSGVMTHLWLHEL